MISLLATPTQIFPTLQPIAFIRRNEIALASRKFGSFICMLAHERHD